jgi:hypothetical protein
LAFFCIPGWAVAFHITLGNLSYETENADDQNFFGSVVLSLGKTLAMFGGNINFEHVFKETTSLQNEVHFLKESYNIKKQLYNIKLYILKDFNEVIFHGKMNI